MLGWANQEQVDAFAKNDPFVMKDTATSAYYQGLARINSDMTQGGVSSIKLVKIEWADVSITSSTSGTDISTNWSGYAATSGTFTQVKGSWMVPALQSTGGISSGATWVGIGGVDSRGRIPPLLSIPAGRSPIITVELPSSCCRCIM